MSSLAKPTLLNPTDTEILAREPLIAFSFYLSGRSNVLLAIGDEIIELLDAGFASQPINGGKIVRAEALMWLWTLGAYEVIRTMCQSRECFSTEFYKKMSHLKTFLAKVRMPAAKMEKQGQRKPVNSNRSPAGWDVSNQDLLIGDPEDENISAKALIQHYKETITSLTISDVLKKHHDSYT